MVSGKSFEAYRKQIEIMTKILAETRRSLDFEERETRLKAACECAALSLKRDLEALVELEKCFGSTNRSACSAQK